jgi:hypothetical protein
MAYSWLSISRQHFDRVSSIFCRYASGSDFERAAIMLWLNDWLMQFV